MADTYGERRGLLRAWGGKLAELAARGLFGKPFTIPRIDPVVGPRAGALEIYAGIHAGPMLRTLSKDDGAILRQLVPWGFVGEPVAFMSGRSLRVEAGWDRSLAQTCVRLAEIGHKPDRAESWIAGVDERGRTVVASLSDVTPHYLFAGTTGSGKSVGLRNAAIQFARYPDQNEIVLVDGKHGESLRALERLPGVVGPVATTIETARAALSWAAEHMRARFAGNADRRRIVVIFDEFQELIGDSMIEALFRQIATQGRAARVHMLAATQHPTVSAFGHSATRRCFPGKAAFMVDDWDASRIAVGGSYPRADHLLGAGDEYACAPGVVHRIQGAYVDDRDLRVLDRVERTQVDQWADAVDVGPGLQSDSAGRSRRRLPTADDLSRAILAAIAGEGRPLFRDRYPPGSRPGSTRAEWLMAIGREVWEILADSSELGEWARATRACLPGSMETPCRGDQTHGEE